MKQKFSSAETRSAAGLGVEMKYFETARTQEGILIESMVAGWNSNNILSHSQLGSGVWC